MNTQANIEGSTPTDSNEGTNVNNTPDVNKTATADAASQTVNEAAVGQGTSSSTTTESTTSSTTDGTTTTETHTEHTEKSSTSSDEPAAPFVGSEEGWQSVFGVAFGTVRAIVSYVTGIVAWVLAIYVVSAFIVPVLGTSVLAQIAAAIIGSAAAVVSFFGGIIIGWEVSGYVAKGWNKLFGKTTKVTKTVKVEETVEVRAAAEADAA